MGAFVCVEPWAGGRGGATPAPTGLGCGTDVPAKPGPVIANQRSPVPSLAFRRPARAVIAPLPPLCGRLAAEPYPLPTAPRAAPAARACPSPATSAPARPPVSPGMALAHGARGWRWRLAGRPLYAAPRSAQDLCVNRPRIWHFLLFSDPRSAKNDP